MFQPTRSRRARQRVLHHQLGLPRGFNPRAREERDARRGPVRRESDEFQPTRSRRARRRGRRPLRGRRHVSTHALAKSATGSPAAGAGQADRFNPRAREERDSTPASIQPSPQCFNPRAREERDRSVLDRADHATGTGVSTHALAKSATNVQHRGPAARNRFNPRAREERDSAVCADPVRCAVSTHALAKSATRSAMVLIETCSPHDVSTHALAKSATGRRSHRSRSTQGFQPTRSRRARPSADIKLGARDSNVSTHALAKSATATRRFRRAQHLAAGFNPRAREERDPRACVDRDQPTRSRRARPVSGLRSRRFNPRAREERDLGACGAAKRPATFQPTRSRRARPEDDSGSGGGDGCFNPRAREERDRDRFHDR